MKKTVLVNGMKCDGCASAVTEKFGALAGVESVEVNLEKKEVTIDGSREVGIDELKSSLADTKYEVQGEV